MFFPQSVETVDSQTTIGSVTTITLENPVMRIRSPFLFVILIALSSCAYRGNGPPPIEEPPSPTPMTATADEIFIPQALPVPAADPIPDPDATIPDQRHKILRYRLRQL